MGISGHQASSYLARGSKLSASIFTYSRHPSNNKVPKWVIECLLKVSQAISPVRVLSNVLKCSGAQMHAHLMCDYNIEIKVNGSNLKRNVNSCNLNFSLEIRGKEI